MAELKTKSRLGRGISSLMGMPEAPPSADWGEPLVASATTPNDAVPASSVPRGIPASIPLDLIDPNPRQQRRHFDDASLSALAVSITANGLIQPITVKPDGTRFQIIAGERRFRAAKIAGLTEIPAYLRDADELAQAQLALVENIQREDLNALDRADGYSVLIHELGLSQQELALRIGEDRSTITNHLRLIELPPDVRDLIRAQTLSLGHAKVLCGLNDPAEQSRLARLVVAQSLSVRNLERLLTTPAGPSPDRPIPAASAHLRDLEVTMSKQLGLRVHVKASSAKGKGKVVIHYNTLDEFDALLAKVGISVDE